jgi:3-phosphoshikimate 1-carboxyvinyltransferase
MVVDRVRIRPAARLEGEICVPGDKSISHRALLFNALAEGEARVTNFLNGVDCRSTIGCLNALGVAIDFEGESVVRVRSVGAGGLREPADVLDAGNSGTTTRLLSGILAGQPFFSVISGDASLRSRPMGRVVEPLRRMGAEIRGRGGDTLAPLAIRGGELRALDYTLPVASAQLKSALLLAGLFAEGETVVREPVPSRDHSERMLAAMGARLERAPGEIRVRRGPLRALDWEVPGDVSAAAFWLVAATIHPEARVRLRNVGLNPTRSGLVDVLRAMGARLRAVEERTVGGEPVADLVVESAALHGVAVGGELIPRLIDEVPALAVAAAVAQGRTEIRDAAELRGKETDRIATTAAELRKLGAAVEERPDGLVIEGGRPLRGAALASRGDHRLAMALAVAASVAEGDSSLDGSSAVEVSYPGFWRDLATIGGQVG